MKIFKTPAYLLPAITVYLFSLGYLYEYSYLDQFGIKDKVFLVEYSTFFVYSFHVILNHFLNNPEIVVGCSVVITFVFIHFEVLRRSLKYRVFIENYVVKHMDKTVFYGYFILFSPIFLTLLILIPVHFGSKEAGELKSNIDKNWHVVVFKDSSEIEGLVIRVIKDQVIFFEKNEPIVHIYNKSEIKDIKSKSKL